VNSRPNLEKALNDILDINGRYFQDCKFSLRFNMDIPDPKGENSIGEASREVQSIVSRGDRIWVRLIRFISYLCIV
jgi:hypothetical protein